MRDRTCPRPRAINAVGPGLIVLFSAVAACDSKLPPPTAPNPPTAVVASPPNPPEPGASGATTDPIVGQYKLELSFASGCKELPEEARQRTYNARIDPGRTAGFVVTLTGGSFLDGPICTAAPSRLGCDQFLGSRTGDLLRFDLINENDDGHGGHIVEQIPPATWIELIGTASGPVQDGAIVARGSASVWYCTNKAGYPFPCSSYGGCSSDDLRLTFTRQ
jgi:hypothetical protein